MKRPPPADQRSITAEPPQLDTCGLKCPLPVIKAEAMLRRMASGESLEILADDPLARVDIPLFCREAGHQVEELERRGNTCVFLVTAGQKIPET